MDDRMIEQAGNALELWDAEVSDQLNREAGVLMAMGFRSSELTVHADRERGEFMVVPRLVYAGRDSAPTTA